MFCISEQKKKEGRYCCAYNCKEPPVAKKAGLCHKHYARKLREKDPVYMRYNQFCGNARRRGKENTITLEQFRWFCDNTGYVKEKGKRGKNATIGRRCHRHGYHIWNIHLETHFQNSKRGDRPSGNGFNSSGHGIDPEVPF